MRRIPLLVVGALALALTVPSAASAHHHRHHHRHHHHHKGHQADLVSRDAGTVASFDGTTLTLTLADGSSVAGKVTDETRIGCVPAVQTPPPTATAAHHGGWDDGDDGDWSDHGGWGDDHHGHCGDKPACDASDLVPGAIVHEALLKLGADGAEFKLVVLVKQADA
jgi:hypothetical protein